MLNRHTTTFIDTVTSLDTIIFLQTKQGYHTPPTLMKLCNHFFKRKLEKTSSV